MGRMRVSGHGKVIHGQIIQAALGRKLKFALFDGMLFLWFVPEAVAWQGIMLHLVVGYMEPLPTFDPVISVPVPICGELPTNTFLETIFAFTPMGVFHSAFRFDAEIEALIFIQTNCHLSA